MARKNLHFEVDGAWAALQIELGMVDISILSGVSDTQAAFAALRPDRSGIEIAVPGILNWIEGLSAREFSIGFNFDWLWLGGSAPNHAELANRLHDHVLFALTDSDGASAAIEQAIKLLALRPDLRVFNHPLAVSRCRRDRLMNALSGLQNVSPPRTIRFHPKSSKDVFSAVESHAFSPPVIFRTAGVHGGQEIALLTSSDDSAALDQFALDGRSYYLIEFKDCAKDNGYFKKYRFVFIGKRIFLRHVISGANWNVHSGSRVMNDETIAYERQLLNNFENVLSSRTMTSLHEINAMLGLDFCGLDCHIRTDGVIVPFEANPAMDIFRNTHPQYDLWDETLARSSAVLFNYVKHPEMWRKAGETRS
ncbi:MAG: hypothetical protein AAFW68_04115 [Pseudomonadota bacterium]